MNQLLCGCNEGRAVRGAARGARCGALRRATRIAPPVAPGTRRRIHRRGRGAYEASLYLSGTSSTVFHVARASSLLMPSAMASLRQALTAWISFMRGPVSV